MERLLWWNLPKAQNGKRSLNLLKRDIISLGWKRVLEWNNGHIYSCFGERPKRVSVILGMCSWRTATE